MAGNAKPMKIPNPAIKYFSQTGVSVISKKPQSRASRVSDKKRSLCAPWGFQIHTLEGLPELVTLTLKKWKQVPSISTEPLRISTFLPRASLYSRGKVIEQYLYVRKRI